MRLVLFFAVIALAEMATFFWVESKIGLAWALGIALGTAIIGSYLVKRSGTSVWGRLRAKVSQSQIPGRELSDGAAILVAGAFLISPGFITDALGFFLLLPTVQAGIYRFITRKFRGRINVFTSTPPNGPEPIQGEVIDVDPE